jgi:hypothetical protein
MRTLTTACLVLFTFLNSFAQYGSFDAAALKAAKATTLIVVLDGGGTPYDRAVMEAIKGDWKFNGSFEFLTMADLAMMPVAADKSYLLKVSKVDPVKFEGTFLTLVQGWKPKKGEMLTAKDNAFTSIPVAQELAYLLIDDKTMNEKNTTQMLRLYVRHIQDYANLVANGKIIDRATADRTYAGRTRLVRDTELWVAKEHMDKSIPDAAKAGEFYTSPMQLKSLPELMGAIEKQDRAITISDVVMTIGEDHKNKHCFKRVFNAATGELMYHSDVQAIFGKKEGFIEDDLKAIERAR